VADSWTATLKDPAVGANFPKGLAAKAADDKTVVFTMDDPTPTFVELHANLAPIFPKGSSREAMNEKPLSGGPFVLDSWQKGQQFVLKRNPYYWNQPYPCLDEVDVVVVGDSNTQALQLQAGQIDIAQDIPPNQIQTLQNTPGVTVPTFPTWASTLVRLNRNKQPAFQDVNVRQAMNYAIDKQGIIDTVLFGTGQVMDSELPRTPNYVPQTPYAYDVEKAKQLMAASQYPNGFSTTILTAAGDSLENGIAAIVKDNLAAIGIQVEIQQVEASTKFDLRGKEDYEMFMATTSSDTFDDSGFLGVTMTD
jgi:peptide/nickel transport system substrate-binding protein